VLDELRKRAVRINGEGGGKERGSSGGGTEETRNGGQHGTRMRDVTMDSGEGWQWGVKTGRGPMRRNERGQEEKKQIICTRPGQGGWIDLACDGTSDKDPRGGAERDSGRGFHLYRGPVPDGIGFVLVADGRGCKTGGLGLVVQRLIEGAPETRILRCRNESGRLRCSSSRHKARIKSSANSTGG
jgi:hypothetical protein